MSRWQTVSCWVVVRFPRSRGDEPCLNADYEAGRQFSPLTRG